MASICLDKDEIDNDILPPICMISGEETDNIESHRFRYTPPAVLLLFFWNPIVWAVVFYFTSKSKVIV
ncbi:MAG: hypothetical protein ACRCZF_16540, partial [Gemmataceae bacterium]